MRPENHLVISQLAGDSRCSPHQGATQTESAICLADGEQMHLCFVGIRDMSCGGVRGNDNDHSGKHRLTLRSGADQLTSATDHWWREQHYGPVGRGQDRKNSSVHVWLRADVRSATQSSHPPLNLPPSAKAEGRAQPLRQVSADIWQEANRCCSATACLHRTADVGRLCCNFRTLKAMVAYVQGQRSIMAFRALRQRKYARINMRSGHLCVCTKFRWQTPDTNYTQPVGLGKPPYLVIGFIGPVSQSLNISF